MVSWGIPTGCLPIQSDLPKFYFFVHSEVTIFFYFGLYLKESFNKNPWSYLLKKRTYISEYFTKGYQYLGLFTNPISI